MTRNENLDRHTILSHNHTIACPNFYLKFEGIWLKELEKWSYEVLHFLLGPKSSRAPLLWAHEFTPNTKCSINDFDSNGSFEAFMKV